MTPYEITFGRKPFNFSEYLAGSSKLNVVDEMLTDREGIFQTIRKKLLKAQEKMKTIADAKRREVEYHPGDWVMLKLRSYRQASAKGPQAFMGKLAKRFYGPFQVLERIGAMAYCLQLPEGTHIHPVFHCLMLKPFKGSPKSVHNIQLSVLLPLYHPSALGKSPCPQGGNRCIVRSNSPKMYHREAIPGIAPELPKVPGPWFFGN